MDPGDDQIRAIHRLLDNLSKRLGEVEQRLGIQHTPPAPATPATLPTPPVEFTRPPAERLPPVAAPFTPSEPPPLAPTTARPAPSHPALPKPARPEPWNIERLVGGRYFLAAGAIVVVIGVGLFLKLGYDMGWFRMSNAWKCTWGAIFGLAMVGAGELARRRINVLASTGLSAAGLGALYLSTYAAHGFYSLIGPAIAFVLLCIVVALGITISVVARQAGVAVLAMLGGYLAPFLLDIEHPSPLVIPFHSLALLVTGLSLSGWLPSVFSVLRTIAWWGTAILGTLWLASQGLDHPGVALPFLALIWAVVHAELIASVRGEYESDAPSDQTTTFLLLRWRNIRPVATSISTSAWCVLFGVLVLRHSPVLPDWLVPAGATAAAALLSMVLAGHLRVLRDSPRTDAQRLGAGLAMQAGALLIAAVALAFSGSLEVCAWLAVGAAAVGAGTWIGAPSLGAYGLVALGIGAARLVTYDSWITRASFAPVSLGSLVVDRWTLLMMAGTAAWITSAFLFRRLRDLAANADPADRRLSARFLAIAPDDCMVVGLVLLLASFLHPDTSAGAVSVAWIAVGVLTGAARLYDKRMRFATYGLGVLLIATIAWGYAYITPGWSETSHGALLHPGALVGAALTLVLALLAVWYRRERHRYDDVADPHWVVCAAWALALAWGVTSLEVYRLAGRIEPGARASVGGLAVWWGMFGIALLIAGLRLRVQALRLAGITGMCLAFSAWAAAFLAPGWTASAHGAWVHPGFIIAAALVAAMGVVANRWRSELHAPDQDSRTTLLVLIVGAILLTWFATSFEAFRLAAHFKSGSRAQHAAVSVWWGFFSVGLLAAGFRWRAAPLRYAGLALLGSATIKALIVDLAEVSAGWRVVSVLGLGLLMLGVALVYVKTSAKLLNSPPSPSGRGQLSRSENR